MTYVLAVALGLVAGVLSGLFGVGGGILFVPTLTWLGLTQLHAEATSLLAIIPTVMVGVWRQQQYGNVRWRGALVIGLASVGAAFGGARLAQSVPDLVTDVIAHHLPAGARIAREHVADQAAQQASSGVEEVPRQQGVAGLGLCPRADEEEVVRRADLAHDKRCPRLVGDEVLMRLIRSHHRGLNCWHSYLTSELATSESRSGSFFGIGEDPTSVMRPLNFLPG